MNQEKILVTSALPYANGPIHFGHIAGAYLPADIFTRYKRMTDADIVYVSGTDEHGFAITIGAQAEGHSPQEHVDKYNKVISNIFKQFNISFDNFSRTSMPHHHKLAQQFFTQIRNNGYISKKTTDQLFCEKCNMFLADRYVYGTCPDCDAENARGDECGACGSWIDPLKLKQPHCKVCNATPTVKQTTHWFLELGKFSKDLTAWLDTKTDWKPNVKNFISKMIENGLEGRAITRDMDWGVKVPLSEAEAKRLYVWFDAPIGYVSATMEWAEKIGQPDKWKDYWYDKNTQLVHFIGKDNLPFHCVVWPAMIMGQDEDFILPSDVPANEFYNLEGKPFSKSSGWYVDIEDFFKTYNTDSIRYCIAAGAPETKDADFTWKDFQGRNNSELADILGNFINRFLKFSANYFENKVPEYCNPSNADTKTLESIKELSQTISQHYSHFHVRKAAFTIMELARVGNRYFDEKAPWKSRKTNIQDCACTINTCIQIGKALAIISYPIIPTTAQKIWDMLGLPDKIENNNWTEALQTPVATGHQLGNAEVLFAKIEDATIAKEEEKLHSMVAKDKADNAKEKTEKTNLITFDQFLSVKMQVGEVTQAEAVKKSKKLLKLQVNLGQKSIQIVSGIKESYQPQDIIGKKVIVVSNLKPAKLMGIESQGMLLAANDNNKLSLITVDNPEISTGSEVS